MQNNDIVITTKLIIVTVIDQREENVCFESIDIASIFMNIINNNIGNITFA